MTVLLSDDFTFGSFPVDLEKSPSQQHPQSPPGGNFKTAVTHYQVLHSTADWSLVSLFLDTGRTHQIRVHMKSTGHPLLGDTLYGNTGESPVSFSFTRAAFMPGSSLWNILLRTNILYWRLPCRRIFLPWQNIFHKPSPHKHDRKILPAVFV